MQVNLKKLEDFLPRNLMPCAFKVAEHFLSKKYEISLIDNVDQKIPYKFHIICKKKYETIAIEIREKCNIISQFKEAVSQCYISRLPVKVFFAVPEKIGDAETSITHAQVSSIESLGIGLLVVTDTDVITRTGTVNCDIRFSLPPGTSLGSRKNK